MEGVLEIGQDEIGAEVSECAAQGDRDPCWGSWGAGRLPPGVARGGDPGVLVGGFFSGEKVESDKARRSSQVNLDRAGLSESVLYHGPNSLANFRANLHRLGSAEAAEWNVGYGDRDGLPSRGRQSVAASRTGRRIARKNPSVIRPAVTKSQRHVKQTCLSP